MKLTLKFEGNDAHPEIRSYWFYGKTPSQLTIRECLHNLP